MLRKFKVVLEPNESGGYTVSVPLLPGCISEGDTRESLEEDGEPVPSGEAVEEAVVEVTA
jgi:predicted RNase H-like HicB family nuclease